MPLFNLPACCVALRPAAHLSACLLAALTLSIAPEIVAKSGEVHAAQPQQTGSKARVNLSARLRSLTEDAAATTCRVKLGVDQDRSLAHLADVRTTFNTILDGLTYGDPRLGMRGSETRGSLLKPISDVREIWSPISDAIDRMVQGTASAADFDLVETTHRELLEKATSLAASISGVYSDPTQLLQRDAITINFLGRQRSLAARFARTTCGMAAQSDAFGSRDEFQEAVQMFDSTYVALLNGFPAAGIAPPPSDAVKSVLSEAKTTWRTKRSSFLPTNSELPTLEHIINVSAFADQSIRSTNNALTLYMIASPGQSDVFQSALESYAQDHLVEWLQAPEVIDGLRAQNAAHADLTQDDIDALDQAWRAEVDGAAGDLIESVLEKPLSLWLREMQAESAGIVTEVFVMDNKGLNVGQSAPTSDFWQGDEAKWQETYAKASPAMHVGELEYDDSSLSYQTQTSMTITDPDTGEPLGAVTFGINVINLM